MTTQAANDADILSWKGHHPITGDVHYERARQDRRIYYRLTTHGGSSFGLTDAKHARETMQYFAEKGWTL